MPAVRATASRLLRSTLSIVLLAAVAAGCGSQEDASGPGTTGPSDRSIPRAVDAELEIVVDHVGGDAKAGGGGLPAPRTLACNRRLPATCRGTVECPPAPDSRPHVQRICEWLAGEGAEALRDEGSDDELCTELYGGPEVARVTGTIDGEEVDATFTRTNGCEINRYDRASPLWTGEVPEEGDDGRAGGSPKLEPEVIDDPPEAFGR